MSASLEQEIVELTARLNAHETMLVVLAMNVTNRSLVLAVLKNLLDNDRVKAADPAQYAAYETLVDRLVKVIASVEGEGAKQ